MPWTETTRANISAWAALRKRHDRCGVGADRAPASAAPPIGPAARSDLRKVIEAILFILATGCQWRALPREFPPYSTVQSYFYAWRDTGRWQRIVTALVRRARRDLGRKPRPTAAVIDSQSAPTTQAGGPRGFDAGKRVYGRKRHIVTDTNGLLLAVHVHPANVQDCHGAVPLLERLRPASPSCVNLCRPGLSWRSARQRPLSLRAVDDRDRQRPPGVKGFQLLPRRWVVERTFAWFGRCRRLAKDFEGSAATEVAWLSWPISGS